MRIVIDARMIYATGIGRYTERLLHYYETGDATDSYIVLMRPQDAALWKPTKANFRRVWAPYNPYTFGEQFKLPVLLRSLRPDLVHFPSFNAPIFYRGRYVVTIHDLTLVTHHTSRYHGLRRLVQGYKQLPFLLVLRQVITHARTVITDTHYVADQVAAKYHLSPARLAPIPLAVEPKLDAAASIERFGITGPFLLYVGNYYPYKNLTRLVQALALLPDGHRLVLTGKEDYFQTELRTEVGRLGIEARVIFAGFVTDGELESLYRAATLYVFPSLSEGFGLPGLEAMTHGVPVIAARASCLPEVYGDAAAYFKDATDAVQMARDLEGLLDDKAELNRLRQAGPNHIKQFDWSSTAANTLEVYRKAGAD